jgi:hypothetical protein
MVYRLNAGGTKKIWYKWHWKTVYGIRLPALSVTNSNISLCFYITKQIICKNLTIWKKLNFSFIWYPFKVKQAKNCIRYTTAKNVVCWIILIFGFLTRKGVYRSRYQQGFSLRHFLGHWTKDFENDLSFEDF